jgi:hypothetical protein
MFIVSGLYRVFVAPEERNVAEANDHPSRAAWPGTPESSLTTFRSSGAIVFWDIPYL